MEMGKGDQTHRPEWGKAEHNSICQGQRQQSRCEEDALSVSPEWRH